MAKYRMCGGLAMMPEHEVKLLEKMSAQGWHVGALQGALLYRFEQGEPHDYAYAIGLEHSFAPEVEELYGAAGWTSVVKGPGWQILRAEAGATPLFTDTESKLEALAASRSQMGKWALVYAAAFVLGLIWMLLDRSGVATVVLIFSVAGLVCTGFPCIGYTLSIRKTRLSG